VRLAFGDVGDEKPAMRPNTDSSHYHTWNKTCGSLVDFSLPPTLWKYLADLFRSLFCTDALCLVLYLY